MNETSSPRKYAVNTAWILIEKMSRIISGLLVGILVARYLGPENLGLISYALNVVAIFTVFSTLGLDSIVVRELIVRNDDRSRIMGTTFMLRLAGAILVVSGATLYSSLRDNQQGTLIVFLVSLSVVMQSFSVVDLHFQSIVRGKFTAISQVIMLLLSSAVKICMIYLHAPVEYFAAMAFFEAAVMCINQYFFYRQSGENPFRWQVSLEEAKKLLGYSWPLIISGFILLLFQKMDHILIKRFLDTYHLGNYSAAARMSEASFFIPAAVCAAILPGVVNTRENKEIQLKRVTQLYSLMIWSALIISIGGSLFGESVISFLYKEKYNLSPAVFRIHIWITIPVFYGTAWGMWMISENRQKTVILFQCICFFVAFALNMKLIPMLGITGAAYALVITHFVSLAATLFIYKPALSCRLFLNALNPLNIRDIVKYLGHKR